MVDIPYNVHGYGLCNEYLFFVFVFPTVFVATKPDIF